MFLDLIIPKLLSQVVRIIINIKLRADKLSRDSHKLYYYNRNFHFEIACTRNLRNLKIIILSALSI